MYVVDDDTQLALKEVDLMVSQAQSELVRRQLLQVRRALRTQIKPNFAVIATLQKLSKKEPRYILLPYSFQSNRALYTKGYMGTFIQL